MNEWKYVESVNEKDLEKLEANFSIKLPSDYKNLLKSCNRGKPTRCRFDISDRKACVLDYFIDLSKAKSIAESIGQTELIPIGNDPFGNIIAYKKDSLKIVFWDHETKKVKNIADSFTDFLNMLY